MSPKFSQGAQALATPRPSVPDRAFEAEEPEPEDVIRTARRMLGIPELDEALRSCEQEPQEPSGARLEKLTAIACVADDSARLASGPLVQAALQEGVRIWTALCERLEIGEQIEQEAFKGTLDALNRLLLRQPDHLWRSFRVTVEHLLTKTTLIQARAGGTIQEVHEEYRVTRKFLGDAFASDVVNNKARSGPEGDPALALAREASQIGLAKAQAKDKKEADLA